ncbi:uncharacterized protein PtrM4_153360 [Pyrenophora tritici-repentis]|uniref:Uncharacterized protein n=1 Tax=Pyrenophora tritici-repentis TaxID=45151 RepID=A0A834VJP0_9PLEO|nr:hypothetical protein PtrM4_153360 [Pyrenophora tritici-repentis]
MFRAPTARSNIAYRVVRVEKERKRQEVEATVLAMVQQKVRKYKSGKIVVYGNSVPKVKGLAEKLKCHAYHHHAVGKASMLEEFMGGKQRVIVATSALGMEWTCPISGALSTWIGRLACWITRRRAGEPGETGSGARPS